MTDRSSPLPTTVPADEWFAELHRFRDKEKALTRELDALNAERRRLPMTPVDAGYLFDSTEGQRSLLQLFDGRSQLVVYHFMFGENQDAGCVGCSWVVDAMSHRAHLAARGHHAGDRVAGGVVDVAELPPADGLGSAVVLLSGNQLQ